MAKVNPTVDRGASTITSAYSSDYSMIYKFAMSTLQAVRSANPLRVLDKGMVENGKNIEQAVLKLAESKAPAYDSTANPFVADSPLIAVRFYKDWTAMQYSVMVKEQELRKVLLANQTVAPIVQSMVANLTETYGYEDYLNMKDVLASARTNSKITKIGNTLNASNTDGILTALKDIVSGFGFVSTAYNTASIARNANKDDIIVLMPYDIKNSIDVNSLAGVFNLDKVKLNEKVIEIDEGVGTNNGYIYVLDKNAFQTYTRLFRLTDQWNPKGLYMNYFLTVEKMYGWSELFNSAYIQIDKTNSQ